MDSNISDSNSHFTDDFLIKSAQVLCNDGYSLVPTKQKGVKEHLLVIDELIDAPDMESINRILLMGLRHKDTTVVNATVNACEARLSNLNEETSKSRFISLILDACFLNLSGRDPIIADQVKGEMRRVRDRDFAASRLFRKVTTTLMTKPLVYEHHISRILARAQHLAHIEGAGQLAHAVVDFEKSLGSDTNRFYYEDVREIYRLRQFSVFESPECSKATLLAYLDEDVRLDVTEVSREQVRMYRILLNVQRKQTSIIRALENLINWMSQIPQPGSEIWEDHFTEMVGRAERKVVPISELFPHVARHLEFQLELLCGPDHPEDLFKLLKDRYTTPQQENILIKGLELLRYFPIFRQRVEEFIKFVEGHGKKTRGVGVWTALIELTAHHVTGLEALIPVRETEELTKSERRKLRVLRKTLAIDNKLRELLLKIATDEKFIFTHDSQIEQVIRETSWRYLLRCLPPDRTALYGQGLLDFNQRFFMATLEEAEALGQRVLWPIILREWGSLFGNQHPQEVIHQRMEGLASYFIKTRQFDAIKHDGRQPGPILRLALDETDSEIRNLFHRVVLEAGYSNELKREQIRRSVLENREKLTESNQQRIEFEVKRSEINEHLANTRIQKAEIRCNVDELLESRNFLILDRQLMSSRSQIEYEQVREQLSALLSEAGREVQSIQEMQRQIGQEVFEGSQLRNSIQTLVSQQNQLETGQRDLTNRIANDQRSLEQNERNHQNTISERRQLERLNVPRPVIQGDEDLYSRALDAYNRQIANNQSTIRNLQIREQGFLQNILTLRNTIISIQNQRDQTQKVLQNLQHSINGLNNELKGVRQRVEVFRVQYQHRVSTWQHMRTEINRLRGEIESIWNRSQIESKQCRNALFQNQNDIVNQQSDSQKLGEQIQKISNELISNEDRLDRQITRSEQLIQAIYSGRQDYDDTSERALQENPASDAAGNGQERGETDRIHEEQEIRILYGYSAGQALRGEETPTREQYRKQKQQKARAGRKST